MSDSVISTRMLQTVGISSSLVLSGLISSFSIIVTPRLMELPTPLLSRGWKNAYQQGKTRVAPSALIPSLSYFYLAYHEYTAAFPAQWKVNAYAAAGVLAVGIAPYTLLIMKATNDKLQAKAAEMSTLKKTDEVVELGLPESETAHKLLDFWAILNLGRASFMLASGLLGAWTALN